MKLSTLEGKEIKLTDIDGDEYIGAVGDYIYPEDNNEQAAIIVDNGDSLPIQFNQDVMVSVEIISG